MIIEFTISGALVLYVILGLIWMFNFASKENIKPEILGDLISMIIFLPFTIIVYLAYLIGFIIEKIIVTFSFSKWWNKKL